jgi:hypothetical protein
MSLTLSIPMNRPRRKGRPRAGADRTERLKHIKCTGLLLGKSYSAAALARLHGVTEKTVYNWRDLALTYDDPEAEGLRRLFRRKAR